MIEVEGSLLQKMEIVQGLSENCGEWIAKLNLESTMPAKE